MYMCIIDLFVLVYSYIVLIVLHINLVTIVKMIDNHLNNQSL